MSGAEGGGGAAGGRAAGGGAAGGGAAGGGAAGGGAAGGRAVEFVDPERLVAGRRAVNFIRNLFGFGRPAEEEAAEVAAAAAREERERQAQNDLMREALRAREHELPKFPDPQVRPPHRDIVRIVHPNRAAADAHLEQMRKAALEERAAAAAREKEEEEEEYLRRALVLWIQTKEGR